MDHKLGQITSTVCVTGVLLQLSETVTRIGSSRRWSYIDTLTEVSNRHSNRKRIRISTTINDRRKCYKITRTK